jgi:hypothetical protein
MAHAEKTQRLETKKKTHSQSNGNADEYATFSLALNKVLTVSHEELQKRIKRNASDREADAKA